MGLATTIAARLSDLVSIRTRRWDRMDAASRRDPGMDHTPVMPASSVQEQRLATVQAIRRLGAAGAAASPARDGGERVDMNPDFDLTLFVSATPLLDGVPVAPARRPTLPAQPRFAARGDRLDGPAEFGVHYETASSIPLDAIDVLDHDVFNAVIARSLQSVRNADGSVRMLLYLANCRDNPLALRLRLHLLRADGARQDSHTPWFTLALDPHSLALWRERAIEVGAASHYCIEIDRDRGER